MEPTLSFIYNHGTHDTAYAGTGDAHGDWRVMNTISGTNVITDKMIFTGGGILTMLPMPTCASGTRDATIKPDLASFVIPQVYVETSTTMYVVPLAGFGQSAGAPSSYRYALGIYVNGRADSDIYLEAWDDATFSTTASEVLVGTANSNWKSLINAVRTTNNAPPWSYPPGWTGNDSEAEFLRGTNYRLALKNASYVEDEAVYYNIYIRLETDCTTFHNTPILGFRYLYT